MIDPTAFTIALIQRDGKSIVVGAACDLAQNQIRAGKNRHMTRAGRRFPPAESEWRKME
jgi:hypothetical protein